MSNDRDLSDTEYHNFQRPPVGGDWEHAWDDLVEDLDANLKLRGELSERPATAPDGSEFEVVDPNSEHHGKIYQYDDGSGEWALADRQYKSLSVERATNRYEFRIFERGGEIVAINDKGAVVETGDFATTSTGGESQLGQVIQACIDEHNRPSSIFLAPPESGDYWFIEQGVTTDKALEIHGSTPQLSDSGPSNGHGTTIVPDDDFSEGMFTFRGDDEGDYIIGSKMKNLSIFGRPSNWSDRSGDMIVATDNAQDLYFEDLILFDTPGNCINFDDVSHNLFVNRCMMELGGNAGIRIGSGTRFWFSDNYYLDNETAGILIDNNESVDVIQDNNGHYLRNRGPGVLADGDDWAENVRLSGIYKDNDGPAIQMDSRIFGMSVSANFRDNATETQDATVLDNTISGSAGFGHFYNGCWFRGDSDNPPDRCIDYGPGNSDYVAAVGGLYDFYGVEAARLPDNNLDIMLEKN